MNLSRINLNLLVALEALLTEKNVTKAGEKIFITQSAMSVSLKQLRELFEDELLVRQGNNLILTKRAEELLPKVKKLLHEAENLIKRETFNPATSQRIFKIGLTEYSAFVLLPHLYKYLHLHSPYIQLQIKHMELHGEKDALEKNEVDLAIGIMEENSGLKLKSELLFTDTLVCAAKKNNPLMRKKLTMEAYLKAKHICFTVKDNTCPYVTDTILSHMGSSREVALRVPHVVPALYVLASSDLIMTLPQGIAQKAQKTFPIVIQKPPFPLPKLYFSQSWHANNENDKGHVWLRFAFQEAAKNVDGNR